MIILELSIGAQQIDAAPVGNSHRVGVQGETMSKDQIIIKKENVETVDKILDYCISTLEFWGYGKRWPTNLIKDSLEECKKILNFVSRSHINDK